MKPIGVYALAIDKNIVDYTSRVLDKPIEKYYADGKIDKIFTTNLIYQPQELLDRDWYCSVNMSKYIALLVETLNYDNSISSLLDPVDRIKKIVAKYGQDK